MPDPHETLTSATGPVRGPGGGGWFRGAPPWFRVAAGLILIAWLFVVLASPLGSGWLRSASPSAEWGFTGALAFLVNLVVLAWGFGMTAEAVSRPVFARTASVLLGATVAVLTARTHALQEASLADFWGPEWDPWLAALGFAGGVLGAILGWRHRRRTGSTSPMRGRKASG